MAFRMWGCQVDAEALYMHACGLLRLFFLIYIHTDMVAWGKFGAKAILGCKKGQGGYGANGCDVPVKGPLAMNESCRAVL